MIFVFTLLTRVYIDIFTVNSPKNEKKPSPEAIFKNIVKDNKWKRIFEDISIGSLKRRIWTMNQRARDLILVVIGTELATMVQVNWHKLVAEDDEKKANASIFRE